MKVTLLFPVCVFAAAAALVQGRVVSAKGQPVQGATISTRLTFTEFARAVSDANGDFKLDLSGDREFSLSVSRAGFLNASAEIPRRQQNSPFAVVVRLTPEAVIAGLVTNEEGLPAAGVNVALLSYQFDDGERFLGHSTARMVRTDETGRYRISGLVAGAYFALADPSDSLGKKDGRYHPQFYGGTIEPQEQNRVVVAAGQVKTDVDFRLRRHEGVCVSGRIVAPAVEPGPQLRRGLGSVELYSTGTLRSRIPAARVSDGAFTFSHILPGEYKLRYRPIGSQFRDGDLTGKQLLVRVGNTDVRDLNIELRTAQKVDLVGKIIFEDGATPRQLSVSITPPNFEDISSGSTISSMDGSFVLKGLPPRHYKLSIVPPGMDNRSRFPNGHEYIFPISIQFDGNEAVKSGFDLDGYSDPRELRVVMSANGAKMRGRALFKDGSARVNATLWLMPAASSLPICVSTDQNGYFEIINIPPDDYRAYFFDNGAGPNSPGYFNDHMNDYPTLRLKAGVNPTITLAQR